jgi:hypothetical protein
VGGTFNDSVCNRCANVINGHLEDAQIQQASGLTKDAKDSRRWAQNVQNEAMDAGCFIVNPI